LLQAAEPTKSRKTQEYGSGSVCIGPHAEGQGVLGRARRILQGVWHDLRVFSQLSTNEYDAVVVKDKFVGALWALWATKRHNIPFVYWLSFPFPEAQRYTAKHGYARFPSINNFRGLVFDRLLYSFLLPACEFALVQSEQMKQDLCERGIDGDKLVPVPMGITQDLLDEAPRVEPAKRPTIAYLGTMVPVRHLDFVIRAFAIVLKKHPDARLLMIGGERDHIEALRGVAVAEGVHQHVCFTGSLSQREALDLVASAHVCLSPFYPTPILNSTSPTKLVEYMALGKPVVANHHPEQTKVINDSDGGLCVDWDETDFAAAIDFLLEQPDVAREKGMKARAYAETRSYSCIADHVEATFKERLCSRQSDIVHEQG
jgi:glycosyltransferase involved in cell wall biosynthesis